MEWINIKDKKPENGANLLVWSGSENTWFDVEFRYGEFISYTGAEEGFIVPDVIGWLIPEPPRD